MTKRDLAMVVSGGWMLLAWTNDAAGQTQPTTVEDNPTAYTALRLISKSLGKEALERVVEVTGHEGVPQPFVWKVILKEGEGSREVDVAGGKIEAQRQLSRPPAASAPIHLADLNLDSSGAFDATNVQARKVKLRYNSLNYDLKVSASTGKPIWLIDLVTQDGSNVGAIRLAAHDGTILSTDGRLAHNAPSTEPTHSVAASTRSESAGASEHLGPQERPRATPRITRMTTTTTTVRTNEPPTGSPAATPTQNIPVATISDRDDNGEPITAPSTDEGGLFTRTGRTLDKTSHTVEHHLRRAGATLQRFFTGHSDIDPDDRRE